MTVHGILVGDRYGDIISKMKWTDGVLRLDQHDRGPVKRGQVLTTDDVVTVQAYGQTADEMRQADFHIVDGISRIAEAIKMTDE